MIDPITALVVTCFCYGMIGFGLEVYQGWYPYPDDEDYDDGFEGLLRYSDEELEMANAEVGSSTALIRTLANFAPRI